MESHNCLAKLMRSFRYIIVSSLRYVVSYLVMCSFHGAIPLYHLVLYSYHLVIPEEDLVLHSSHSIMYPYHLVMSSFYLVIRSFSLVMRSVISVMRSSHYVLFICALFIRFFMHSFYVLF